MYEKWSETNETADFKDLADGMNSAVITICDRDVRLVIGKDASQCAVQRCRAVREVKCQ